MNWRSIMNTLKEACEKSPLIEGFLVLGSHAGGIPTPRSDLDLAVVEFTDQTCEKGHAQNSNAIEKVIGGKIHEVSRRFFPGGTPPPVNFAMGSPHKQVYFIGDALAKCEVFIVQGLGEIQGYLPKGVFPEEFLLVDKRGRLQEELIALNVITESGDPVKDNLDRASRVQEEIHKILYGFDACSTAHASGDGYRFYFEYNLLLHRLVRVVALMRGFTDRLYLPKQVTHGLFRAPDDRDAFRSLRGTITNREGNAVKRRFLAFLYDRLQEVQEEIPGGLPMSLEAIKLFCERVYARDFLWNLRDFADASPDTIRSGLLFRSSSLVPYVGTPELDTWFSRHDIGQVIDLRWDWELETESYPERFFDERGIQYVRVPWPVGFVQAGRDYYGERWETFPRSVQFYAGSMAERSDTLGTILEYLTKGIPTVVHCAAGKDRTGVLFTLLHLILGTEKTAIIGDYMGSGINVSKEKIDIILNFVKDVGGISGYLSYLSLFTETNALFRTNFAKEQDD